MQIPQECQDSYDTCESKIIKIQHVPNVDLVAAIVNPFIMSFFMKLAVRFLWLLTTKSTAELTSFVTTVPMEVSYSAQPTLSTIRADTPCRLHRASALTLRLNRSDMSRTLGIAAISFDLLSTLSSTSQST